jgi:hypothetical protein
MSARWLKATWRTHSLRAVFALLRTGFCSVLGVRSQQRERRALKRALPAAATLPTDYAREKADFWTSAAAC